MRSSSNKPEEGSSVCETIPVRLDDLSTILNALQPLPDHVRGEERKQFVRALLRIGSELEQLPDLAIP